MDGSEWGVFVAIAVLFYIPVHFLPPVLLVFLYSSAGEGERRKQVISMVIDCLITLVITTAIVAWVWIESEVLLMWPFMLALFPPYIRVWKLRRLASE